MYGNVLDHAVNVLANTFPCTGLIECIPMHCSVTFCDVVSIVFWHILDHTGYVFGPFFAVGQLFLSLDHLYYNYCIFTLLSLTIELHLIVLMVFKSVDSITAKNNRLSPIISTSFRLSLRDRLDRGRTSYISTPTLVNFDSDYAQRLFEPYSTFDFV